MNDTSGTILKIVTALTSTKTAIKFISIAIFLLISGQAIEEFVVQSGSPVEYQKTIIFFSGLGLGSIVGDIIIRFGLMIYSVTIGYYKKVKYQQQKQKDMNKKRNNLLEHFSITYENMDKESQRELWALAQGKVSIWDDPESNSNIHIFVSNGYAKHFSTVNEHQSIYELRPVLIEHLKATVPQKLNQTFSDFQADQSEQMLSLLDLLGGKCELETCSFDANEYVRLCETHHELLEYNNYYGDGDDGFSSQLCGYDIYIDPYHEVKLEKLYDMRFRKIRIPISTIYS